MSTSTGRIITRRETTEAIVELVEGALSPLSHGGTAAAPPGNSAATATASESVDARLIPR